MSRERKSADPKLEKCDLWSYPQYYPASIDVGNPSLPNPWAPYWMKLCPYSRVASSRRCLSMRPTCRPDPQPVTASNTSRTWTGSLGTRPSSRTAMASQCRCTRLASGDRSNLNTSRVHITCRSPDCLWTRERATGTPPRPLAAAVAESPVVESPPRPRHEGCDRRRWARGRSDWGRMQSAGRCGDRKSRRISGCEDWPGMLSGVSCVGWRRVWTSGRNGWKRMQRDRRRGGTRRRPRRDSCGCGRMQSDRGYGGVRWVVVQRRFWTRMARWWSRRSTWSLQHTTVWCEEGVVEDYRSDPPSRKWSNQTQGSVRRGKKVEMKKGVKKQGRGKLVNRWLRLKFYFYCQ